LKKFGKKKKEKNKPEESKEDKDKQEENGEEDGKKKISKKLLIILIAVFVLITAGGVYFFFFSGGEEGTEEVKTEHAKEEEGHGGGHGEHGEEKMSIEDSLALHRKKPLTPEEIGEHIPSETEYSVDVNKPEQPEDISYLISGTELEDPLSIKDFPNEVKISNTLYKVGNKYMVQVSSWKRSSRAITIVEKLRRAGYNAFIVKAYLPSLGGTWYRVRIGFFKTLEEAKEFLRKKEYLNVR
jgi:hypothetical protein